MYVIYSHDYAREGCRYYEGRTDRFQHLLFYTNRGHDIDGPLELQYFVSICLIYEFLLLLFQRYAIPWEYPSTRGTERTW